MFGQGHYFCRTCGHAVYAQYGGCRTCQTPLASLVRLELAFDRGWVSSGIGFDPYDGQFAFDIGGGLAIEPDGQLDVETPFGDVPIQDDPFTDPFGW